MYEEYSIVSCNNDLMSRVGNSSRNSLKSKASVRDDGTHDYCDE
jgi:hypothetical protein